MLKRILLVLAVLFASGPAFASDCWNNSAATQTDCGSVTMFLNGSTLAVPVTPTAPLPMAPNSYPSGATPITGNATGTTGAVVGTLAAAVGKTTYICGFHLDSAGTGAIGPITMAGLVGSSMVFQGTAGANNNPAQTFTPCIPASAPNTAITITTTADGTATAVDVNSWGYQQ